MVDLQTSWNGISHHVFSGPFVSIVKYRMVYIPYTEVPNKHFLAMEKSDEYLKSLKIF